MIKCTVLMTSFCLGRSGAFAVRRNLRISAIRLQQTFGTDESSASVEKKNWMWRWRRRASAVLSAAGFVNSSARALFADPSQYKAWSTTVDSLTEFLQTSGIDLEIATGLNIRLLDNIILLNRIETAALKGRDRRDMAVLQGIELPDPKEALRYVKYATAAYGDNMIRAAELDVKGTLDGSFSSVSRSRISQHCGIPENSIIRFDIKYDGNYKHLRHFVAVDHAHKVIVLAIRGTFSISEVVADVAGFSRPFCCGEAHSEMANMAEKVWKSSESSVLKLLEDNPDYELIITGHSLGAGTASLLCILLHDTKVVPPSRVRCFSFASPPVFAPIETIPEAVSSCVNYVHEADVVPFLSVDAIRHLFNCVQAMEDQQLSWRTRLKIMSKYEPPSQQLIDAFQAANKKRLPPKEGAPVLAIPARCSVWMRENELTGMFNQRACDSAIMSKMGIFLASSMLDDHYPSRYEHALHNLEL